MKSILIIDDKRNNLITISALINEHIIDCIVHTALSGEDGIQIARKTQPDTILLDIIMPGLDGFETCKKLKNDELTKHIPVVLITAIKNDTESRIQGLNIGADAFLSKPIEPAEFIAQINVMLRIKEAEDRLRKEKRDLEELVEKRTIELSQKNEVLQSEILKHRHTEDKLKKLSLRNQLILENTMEGYILTNPEGRVIDVNPAYCKLIGYTRKELLDMNIRELDIDLSETEKNKRIKRLVKDGCTRTETKHRRKNGQLLNLDMSVAIMYVDAEPMVIAFIRDITKRKHSEKLQKVLFNISNAANTTDNLIKLIGKIKVELGAVIDTTNFYIALYHSENDTISLPFIADEKDKVTSIPAGKTLTNYVIKTKKPLLATKNKIKELEEADEVGRFGSDSEIWLGVPLKLKGDVIGVLAVQSYTDEFAYDKSDMEVLEFISEQISISIDRKNAEQELKDALAKATESDQLKSVFLATMSHELRTPLNAVIGFSEIIRNENLPLSEIMQFNKSINISGNNLLSIVEDIFEIALIETGEVNLVKEKVNLISLLNEINELIIVEQQNTDKIHIELKLTTPEVNKEISLNTDPLKFKQILINLLKNALKFTIKGTVEYGFNVKQDHDKSFLEFFVKDTGIGIPKQKKKIIFEMFRQIEETHSRTYGGIGLGLTIAKRLTEILGGKMWLDTDEQTGSTFYFTVPFNDFLPDENDANLKIQALSDGKKEKILIVEDDDLSLSFLKILLKKSGINTICVKSGEAAILSCKNDPDIKLVLMDINMPRMDGYEATMKIKEMCPDMPIIAQTAYAIPGDREKLSQAGCDDYISKPINKKMLMDKIKKYFK